jgi:hypothetical protein
MTAHDLARRAVAAPHWRWMPGMVALDSTGEEHPGRVIDDRKSLVYEDADGAIHEGVVSRSDLPDLSDPATVGALLALVREAWEPHRGSDYIASTMHTGSGWGVGARYGSEGLAAIVLPTYETEAAALVAALEAAP